MIKLLAFDIDDTLTKQPRIVPEKNLEAIKRAQAAGVFVTVATGRGYLGSSYIWKAMGVKGPVINYGGAVINDTRTGRAIYTTELEPDTVKGLFKLADSLGVHAHLYQGDGMVFARDNPYVSAYSKSLDLPRCIDPLVGEKTWHNVPKVLFITEPDRAEALIPMLGKRYEGRLKVSGSVPGFIEFNAANAHKGSALEWLADSMGIKRSEVAAVGDNLLDIEMIRYAGIGAAVGDAHKEVISAADVVLPKCEDMAAAWFIDNIVLRHAG